MALRLVLLGFLVLVSPLILEASDTYDTAFYDKRITMVLDDLVKVISGGDRADRVHEAVSTAIEQLRSNKAAKYLDPDEKGILSGMKFTYHLDNPNFGLSFGPVFLETYTTKSSTHLAVLVHEMWHLRDFVKQHDDFYGAAVGSREKLRYELDAFYVEAEFIRDYLQKARSLNRFDSFVLDSFQKDNLDSVLLFMHQQSSEMLYYFLDVDRDFAGKKRTGVELISTIGTVGRQKIATYNAIAATNEFQKYVAYMEVRSFRIQMLKSLPLLLQSPKTTWDQVFESYPDIGFIYNESLAIEKTDNEKQSSYLKKVVDWWENEIRESQ